MNATITEFVINNVSIVLDLTHVSVNLVTLCRMTRKLVKLKVNNQKNLILIYLFSSYYCIIFFVYIPVYKKITSIFRKFVKIYLKKNTTVLFVIQNSIYLLNYFNYILQVAKLLWCFQLNQKSMAIILILKYIFRYLKICNMPSLFLWMQIMYTGPTSRMGTKQ